MQINRCNSIKHTERRIKKKTLSDDNFAWIRIYYAFLTKGNISGDEVNVNEDKFDIKELIFSLSLCHSTNISRKQYWPKDPWNFICKETDPLRFCSHQKIRTVTNILKYFELKRKDTNVFYTTQNVNRNDLQHKYYQLF